jgi:hypothetical protein
VSEKNKKEEVSNVFDETKQTLGLIHVLKSNRRITTLRNASLSGKMKREAYTAATASFLFERKICSFFLFLPLKPSRDEEYSGFYLVICEKGGSGRIFALRADSPIFFICERRHTTVFWHEIFLIFLFCLHIIVPLWRVIFLNPTGFGEFIAKRVALRFTMVVAFSFAGK